MSHFWDVFQRCLETNVEKNPTDYALAPGESAQAYAKRVRAKMGKVGIAGCNHNSATFRAVARHFGVKFTLTALIAAEAANGGKDQ
jgi:hypothetical protein